MLKISYIMEYKLPKIKSLYEDFIQKYKSDIETIWDKKSTEFRTFWQNKILNSYDGDLADDEIDPIVRILDAKGKGNTKESVSVANAMVPQGAWHKLFREIKLSDKIKSLLDSILKEQNEEILINFIDMLYHENQNRKNRLTGPSGNVINDFLFAYNPKKYVSIVSLNDRQKVIEHFHLNGGPDFTRNSIGTKIVTSNRAIIDGFKEILSPIQISPRRISDFLYSSSILTYWKQNTELISTSSGNVIVSIPLETETDHDSYESSDEPERNTSKQYQAKLAEIGEKFGFKIWIPVNDRERVLKYWTPKGNSLLDELNIGFSGPALKTVKNIDILWVKNDFVANIVRAFEVEHTTSVISGILRMADLVTILPNISIKLYIVADEHRREKVYSEIRRPAFFNVNNNSIPKICSYLSYISIDDIYSEKNLKYMHDGIVDQYAENFDDSIQI